VTPNPAASATQPEIVAGAASTPPQEQHRPTAQSTTKIDPYSHTPSYGSGTGSLIRETAPKLNKPNFILIKFVNTIQYSTLVLHEYKNGQDFLSEERKN
jgi:hypothetical protein